MKQNLHATGQQQLVCSTFQTGHVVGLNPNAALHAVLRCVDAAQGRHACQQIVHHAVHDLPHLAVFAAIQTGKVGHPARCAHAAQKAITLHQQHPGAVPGGADAGRKTGRPAAHDHDIELAVNGKLARWLENR